jgi:hypothetical protein
MLDARVVTLAVEYLDTCQAEGHEATLVGMHWYVDGRNKTMPVLSEVNAALALRPNMRVSRINCKVVFSAQGSEGVVTSEDMRRAGKDYRSEFSTQLRALRRDA